VVQLTCSTRLTVRDNGLALFRRFHNHVDGTGPGLYTVKKIVENRSGRVEVHRELSTGSTFQVYVPA
jgi:sensor histidine kinase regulating citrate/malate metabolism